MSQRLRVYVAGAISQGNLRENIKKATDAGHALMRAGFAPLVPHLTCFWSGTGEPEVLPRRTTHEDWLDIDLPWVAVSDALLRLPGESVGADREAKHAEAIGIPIYFTLNELIDDRKGLELARFGKESSVTKAGDQRFYALLEQLARTHEKKALDYGSVCDPLANIRASAEIGIPSWKAAWMRAKDKVKRIDNYCLKGKLANEGVEDSFIDLAAYALIALIMHREEKTPDLLSDKVPK